MEFMKHDKIERKKEREADMEFFREYILKGVQEQVEVAIKPMQEKQSNLEEEQVIMQEQISKLLQEVKELKEKSRCEEVFPQICSKDSPSLASSVSIAAPGVSVNSGQAVLGGVDGKVSESELIVDAAKRTLGFQCVNTTDVERQFRVNGAGSHAEARWLAIREFSECELKVSRDVFENLEIEEIFPPAKNSWDTLYVQFACESSVQTLYKYARNLQKNQRLVPYIPKELYPRFRELQSIAYTLRHSDLKYKTNIKIVDSNLILFKRKPSEYSWTAVMIPQVQHQPSSPPSEANLVQLNLRPQSAFSFNRIATRVI